MQGPNNDPDNARPHAMEHENVTLRAALTEALALFDATWCPEHGHAPSPEQLARIEVLRKMVKP